MPQRVAVIDIGKTNAKVALVDLAVLSEIDKVTTPNRVTGAGPYPHYDVERLWDFILSGLAVLHRRHGIDAVSVTTHGASAVLLGRDGSPVLPVLDYEHDGPEATAADYDVLRPEFALTGSPRLPNGLNLGAQLHWQKQRFPDQTKGARVLTYPQYWVQRLTGNAASEVTSLGCHTDLWMPDKAEASPLVERLGLELAPVHKAADCMGSVLPGLGLPGVPVVCGIHDSNASLYPHLLWREAPFSVVSTGTWVIAMAVGGDAIALDPSRDTLINVNALGQPTRSARFMGGREYETLRKGRSPDTTERDVEAVLAKGVMLLPAVEPGSGPFQGRRGGWNKRPGGDGEAMVALGFYLALMTSVCLEMIGARGPVIVEGPFAGNDSYLAMLSAATGQEVLTGSGSATGTSVGAALLAATGQVVPPVPETGTITARLGRLAGYAVKWRELVAAG